MKPLRISFLHLAPVTSDIVHNRQLVEQGVKLAAQQGAQWVITPELCIPGYLFMSKIGTDWILPQPDPWMNGFLGLVKAHGLTVFLSHPERDPATEKMYNTVFVIDRNGEIIGKHRKVKALGGADGLVHLSELSWERDVNPEEAFSVGGDVDVYVMKIDQETKKIGLSIRRARPEQWDDVVAGYYELSAGNGENTEKVEFWVYPYQTSFIQVTIDN